jgi:hypothetical protein
MTGRVLFNVFFRFPPWPPPGGVNLDVTSPLQTIFTPSGLAKKDENSLLVTPLRIIRTTHIDDKKKRCVLVDPDNIDHNVKHANKKAMEYYLENKVVECKKGLLKKLLAKYYGWPSAKFVMDFDVNKIPLSVADEFNRSIVNYKNSSLLNYAKENFLRYVFKIETTNKYLVLGRNDDPDFKAFKLLLTRYHNSYCKKIKKRMDWLAYKYRGMPAVLLTLTFDPKRFNNDKFVICDGATKELDRFLQALRMHFKRSGRSFPKYLWAPEFQKNGNIHFHILFFGARRLIDWRKILAYWRNGAIYLNRTKDGDKVRYPINYVTNYITKSFGNTNFDNLQTQSMLWLFNLRSFNRSKGLIVPLNPGSSGEFYLDYLAMVDKHSNCFEEMDLIDHCLLHLLDPSNRDRPPPAEGKYVISSDDDEIYSTDSPFWANFFGSDIDG